MPIRKSATLKAQEAGIGSAHGRCACEGVNHGGMWVHSARCPETVILWFKFDHKPDDWTSPIYRCCPYQCPGAVLASGVTHHWQCQFWADHNLLTPF